MGSLLCGNPGLPPDLSFYIPNILFFCVCSKHHKSFDPFQEQKETSFKELQSSAESLAQFLCEAMETTSVNSGDGGGAIKSVFDTLLQVRKFVRKKLGFNLRPFRYLISCIAMILHNLLISETHKGLKCVTPICFLCLMLVNIHFRKYYIWDEKKR